MAEPWKILLLEGGQSAALSLAAAIRKKGWEVIFASDSVLALSVARRAKPNAIVLNSQLPGGGGLMALKRIRSCVHTAVIPVVAIGAASKRAGDELLSAGAQESLGSPADAEAIVSAVERQLLRPLAAAEAPAEEVRKPARMAALENTGLLDSPPEQSFDRLTQLAAKLLGAPTALLSLVDKNRQFFKSQAGLGEPWSSRRETPLSHSFCQWVVSGREDLVVDDARQHPVLSSNLAVRDLGVVAYAGVPLSADPDQAIGSFCAVDSKPRPWTEQDLATLRDLAEIVGAYVILQQARRAGANSNTGAAIAPGKLMQAAGNAIAGATRILGRGGSRLGDSERRELQEIVKKQSQDLLRLAT